MGSGTQMGGPLRMRANRTVVATKCLTCGFSFTFGEEVCACNVCGGYHHASCWDAAGGTCKHTTASTDPSAPITPGGATPSPQSPPAAVAPIPPVQPVPVAVGMQPSAPPAPPGEVRKPAADEQYCSQCREIIKAGALKCRY